MFAFKAIGIAFYPFDIVHQQVMQIILVNRRKMVEIIKWVKMVKGITDFRILNRQFPAEGFDGRYIQIRIGLKQDFHPFKKMGVFAILRQKCGLGENGKGKK
jgi:hypothetical protein